MSNNKSVITFIIPAYNEEKGIGDVIENIPTKELESEGFLVDVLVVDDGSDDETVKVARSKGARIIKHHRNNGKGSAIQTAFKNISPDTEYAVMLDADNTYDPKESTRLLGLLKENFCDIVIGSRLSGKIEKGSMSYFNRIGNWIFTFLVRILYKGNITDSCSGYVAWKREVMEDLGFYCESNGFSIEMEMITKARKLGYCILSIPISYRNRSGRASSLHPLKDGYKILKTLFKNLTWGPGSYGKNETDKDIKPSFTINT